MPGMDCPAREVCPWSRSTGEAMVRMDCRFLLDEKCRVPDLSETEGQETTWEIPLDSPWESCGIILG
jgi:hypothetical protein